MSAAKHGGLRKDTVLSDHIFPAQKVSLGKGQKNSLPHRMWKECVSFITGLISKFNLRRCNKVGRHTRTKRRPHVENRGSIVIGDEVSIDSRNIRTHFATGREGYLEIGDKTSIGFGVSIVANKSIKIGKRVQIGSFTMIYDSNLCTGESQAEKPDHAPVVIEDDVCLTSRIVVLKGCRIGKGSIISAGSVVSGIIPPYVVAGGIPATITEYLNPPLHSGFHWEHNNPPAIIKKYISSRVRKVVADLFSTDIDSVRDEHSHNTYSNWTSLQHVKLIHALEREFNIRLNKEDWIKMSSIGSIVHIIHNYLLDEKAKGQRLAQIKT